MISIRRRKWSWLCGIGVLGFCWMLGSVIVGLEPFLKVLPRTQSSSYSDTANITEEIQDYLDELTSPEDLEKAYHLLKELQEAKRLYEEVRILCWVLMYPDAHNTTAKLVKETWGKRCNRLIFMSTKDDPSIGAVNVGSIEGYHSLYNKTRHSMKYIYKNLLYEYEWFLKADDNTYMVVDNVRYMLQAYNTDDPVAFGQHFKTCRGYNTGGAGYILGREAVRRFVEEAMPNPKICRTDRRKGEDVGLGNCLHNVGIMFGDTRDDLGQGRFWQLHPSTILENPRLLARYAFYPVRKGERPDDCCSDTVISFHELTATDFHLLEYLIYKVRVFGHIPTLPLRVPLPPDLSVVPERTIKEYRKHTGDETENPPSNESEVNF